MARSKWEPARRPRHHDPAYEAILTNAIKSKRLVSFTAKGCLLVAEPHVLGWQHGELHILTFQVGGQSNSGACPSGGASALPTCTASRSPRDRSRARGRPSRSRTAASIGARGRRRRHLVPGEAVMPNRHTHTLVGGFAGPGNALLRADPFRWLPKGSADTGAVTWPARSPTPWSPSSARGIEGRTAQWPRRGPWPRSQTTPWGALRVSAVSRRSSGSSAVRRHLHRRTDQVLVSVPCRAAAGFCAGLQGGYLSHLLLDAGTPAGLPFV